jgi:hypothetical protein
MDPVQKKIYLWGGPKSGKSTYLGALALAAYQSQPGGWVINGQDAASIDFLLAATAALKNGAFPPPAPSSARHYSFQICGKIKKWNGRFSFLDQYTHIDLELHFTDRPGQDFLDAPQETAADMAGCDGLILLYDYALDQADNPNFEYIHAVVEYLRLQSAPNLLPHARLPQHLAVCLSKYDHAPTFQWLYENQMITWDGAEYYRNIPYLAEPRRALSRLDNLVLPLLERNFDPQRIAYFGVSSAGFFHRPDGGVEPNVQNADGTPSLRSGGDTYPLNVLGPMLWLAGRLYQPQKGKQRILEPL